MKLSTNSTVDINVLKGALIINEHGAEFRCSGIGLNITQEMLAESNLEVVIQMQEYDGEGELMDGTVEIPLNSLKDWTFQIQIYD